MLIVDAHLDLAYDLYNKRCEGRTHIIEAEYLDDFIKGGVNVIVSSIYVDSKYLPAGALQEALGQIGALYAEIEETEQLCLCRSYDEICEAHNNNKIAILLGFEGVEPIGHNLELLPVFYELGIRVLGLCWSRRNEAADGALFSEVEQGQKSGLSPFGYQLVRLAEELGMIVDIAHLNDEGVDDVMKITKNPIMASHANCRALHGTMRNLSDKQLKEMAAKNGVIGVNGVSSIVASSVEDSTVEKLADHIQHIIEVAGEDHVGLGFDMAEKILPPGTAFVVDGNEVRAFDVIQGYSKISKLTEVLKLRGFSDERISKIYGENFMRLFKESLK